MVVEKVIFVTSGKKRRAAFRMPLGSFFVPRLRLGTKKDPRGIRKGPPLFALGTKLLKLKTYRIFPLIYTSKKYTHSSSKYLLIIVSLCCTAVRLYRTVLPKVYCTWLPPLPPLLPVILLRSHNKSTSTCGLWCFVIRYHHHHHTIRPPIPVPYHISLSLSTLLCFSSLFSRYNNNIMRSTDDRSTRK